MDVSFELTPCDESFEEIVTFHQCDVCTYSTKHVSNLRRHNRTVHIKPTTTANPTQSAEKQHHICDQCGKQYLSKYGLSLHVKSQHQNIFRFTCSNCNRGFNQLWNYRGHLNSHFPELKEKCNSCGMSFAHRASLVSHKRSCEYKNDANNNTTEMKSTCKECNVNCKNKKSLKEHMNGAHGFKKYRCELCGKLFKWRSSLQYHVKHVAHSD